MSMLAGGRGQRADINVTPMIDVLLVLIIIFMVITPTESHGLRALVPQTAPDTPNPPPSPDIVISVARDNVIQINQEPVEFAVLPQRLAALFRIASRAHLFVRGDRDLSFREVAQVIDMARGAGWDRIGLMTR